MELKITIEAEGIEPVIVKGDVPVENGLARGATEPSCYAKLFDSKCHGWTMNPYHNVTFLELQQNYTNELLRSRGVLFLNEVYDMLGIPRTAAGQRAGWIFMPDYDVTDYVDFSIRSAWNTEALKGNDDSVMLDFNVRDNILKYL